MNKGYNPCMDNGKDVPWFTNPELESTQGPLGASKGHSIPEGAWKKNCGCSDWFRSSGA